MPRLSLEELINRSINDTLARTLMTSLTTLCAALPLLVLGGPALRGFSFVLTVGVVVGTYSTIYIAGPFTLLWESLRGRRAGNRPRPVDAGDEGRRS
jgi:preprotein translocase subunit SecF